MTTAVSDDLPVPADLLGTGCPLCGGRVREVRPAGDGLVALGPCGCVVEE
ncbi:hypothetical protein GCM10009678_29450 [Actinomadura kijaniata]|uniref:Uncharacterized protein n=1 Tax=Actinomadura namibiensis TaxID=182080 RepID=A0A7W3LK07_ACTNM|nr:hypothetical protein [Actinomadura namibiensis]MBA8949548.1 hypothetical protein [Actinomadura namibiensis]